MSLTSLLVRRSTPGNIWLIKHAAHRGLLGRRFARVLPIDRAARADSGWLYHPVVPICEVPRQVHEPAKPSPPVRPFQISWHRMADACIDGHSSFFVRKSEAYLQTQLYSLVSSRGDFSGRFCWHSGFTARRSPKAAESLERGIALFGCGAYNWYHWMVEVVPRAMCAQRLPSQFDDWPLIAPPEVATIPQFADSLARVAGRRRILVSSDAPLRVRDLIWIDSPSILPFNLTRGWPVPSQCFSHRDAIEDMSRIMGSVAPRGGACTPRRVLLVRSHSRRTYNQDEVLTMACDLGFEAVSPETLSLAQQAELFQNADFLLGPSGAAWTGLMFARDGARGLIWVGEQYRGFNAYANLASSRGFDLRFFFHPLDAKTTGQGYGAPYRIDVSALREAVVAMLHD